MKKLKEGKLKFNGEELSLDDLNSSCLISKKFRAFLDTHSDEIFDVAGVKKQFTAGKCSLQTFAGNFPAYSYKTNDLGKTKWYFGCPSAIQQFKQLILKAVKAQK